MVVEGGMKEKTGPKGRRVGEMVKKVACSLAVVLVVLLSACSEWEVERKVMVRIPEHPWEVVTGKRLWYTIKWTDGQGMQVRHLNQEERSIEISVRPGETVLVAAYPLGDMAPYGIAITPLNGESDFLLTQEDGVLVGLLIDLDKELIDQVNFDLVLSKMRATANDIRAIDSSQLLRDIQNGELSSQSFKDSGMYQAGPFALTNGLWESEFFRDSDLAVTGGLSAEVTLPPGVYNYLNVEERMVMTLVIDLEGDTYNYLHRSIV